MSENNCIFCRIVAGEAPASLVYEDEAVVAFVDTTPINAGHVLVIPRRHAEYLADMRADEAAPMWEAARQVATGLRTSGLRCDGVNFHLADGAAAGQEVRQREQAARAVLRVRRIVADAARQPRARRTGQARQVGVVARAVDPGHQPHRAVAVEQVVQVAALRVGELIRRISQQPVDVGFTR